MAVTAATLLALGTRPVVVTSVEGTFTGSIVPDRLSADSVMVQIKVDGDPGLPIVIAIDNITEVRER